ncbi:hypothetical protein IGI89_001612 [Enterococcus sp. AZ141]|uniref:hypothetical protein n=1 Tax=Enterococcus sp. AZ141 TaxID=2774681 RepID=UPI003F26A8D2
MANIIWKSFKAEEQNEYIHFLKIFGALSGLFKDNQEGTNAQKPYLYYRNHEQLYAKVFDVEDLTRKDSAFDAVAKLNGKNVGVGLKTWIHSKDKTYQKVAEFNKLAPEEIRPLIDHGSPEEVIRKVAQLRNDRIWVDKRLYNTNEGDDIYHYITRDNEVMNIVENPYDLVQLDSLKLLSSNGKTFSFTDGLNNYKFYASKSVLLEEFDASPSTIITSIGIKQFDNPFELIKMIELPQEDEAKSTLPDLYLPLYSVLGSIARGDKRIDVPNGAGINKWHRARENNRPWDVEIRIPKWIHEQFNGWFFGHNFIDTEKKVGSQQADFIRENPEAYRVSNKNSLNYVDFTLRMPDGSRIEASVNGANGKNLQSKRSKDLGYWILHTVIGIPSYEMENKDNDKVVTIRKLKELDIDSIRLSMIDEKNRIIGIDVAEFGAFEAFSERYGQAELVSELVQDIE